MSRVSVKITGAQGQGVNSVGGMCAKGLKRSGYCVFGYREYMSLIKGGHSSYQLDIGTNEVRSSQQRVDILVCLDHYGLRGQYSDLHDVKDGGILLHRTAQWKFNEEEQKWLDDHNVTVLYLPTEKILKEFGARPIVGNVVVTSVLWSLLGQDLSVLKDMVENQFKKKGEKVIELNFQCIDAGTAFVEEEAKDMALAMPEKNDAWKEQMLITGSEAIGLGAVHAGCRMYAGYPMTPSSPLLDFMAHRQNRTGMVVKQAEDEITAVQMMAGAMHMGTRAMTATSGGGFDLMSETLSMNGITETPGVVGLAMRSGPGTGLPTWTGQGDLLLAVHAGHGEFPRCVVGLSDSQDAFDLMPQIFNIADTYQIPVVFLYDKQVAEALYTQKFYDQDAATIDRGLVTDQKELDALKGTDRYDPDAEGGVSKRWLPGAKAATYCAQGDEHNADGTVVEDGPNAKAQAEKRMKKLQTLKNSLPEPELYGAENPEVLLVGWGSTKGPVLDVLEQSDMSNIGYLHYTYLWPLKSDRLKALSQKAKKVIVVEGNTQGQLGMLLQQESCVPLETKILKYDGRPFFYEEFDSLLRASL